MSQTRRLPIARVRSTVMVERLIDCPFSVAQDYAERFLVGAEAGGNEGTVHAGPFTWSPTITFSIHSDETEVGRPHDEIRFTWRAHNALLPDFSGTLYFRIAGLKTRCLLAGDYLPPGGALGASFDRLIGRHIAYATCADLLNRIAVSIGERFALWRADALARMP